MWRARNNLECRALYERGGKQRGIGDGYDLIIVTVKNQRGHVYPLQIPGAVRFRERLNAVKTALCPASIPCSQKESIRPCDTFAPGRLNP